MLRRHLSARIIPFTRTRWISSVNQTPYHALLDMPESPNPFVVDLQLLRRNFLKAQRKAHPDVRSREGNGADAQSAEINTAYQTLLSPLKRAEYLLALKGIAINEEMKLGSRITEEGKLGSESHMMEFLLEVMEARQELENAETEEEIESIMSTNKDRILAEVKVLEEHFANENYASALRSCIRLRYWQTLEQAAKELG